MLPSEVREEAGDEVGEEVDAQQYCCQVRSWKRSGGMFAKTSLRCHIAAK